MKTRTLVLLILPLAIGVLVFAGMEATGGSKLPGPEFVQPFRFDHAKHMAANLKCTDCHKGVESSPYATIPTIQKCLVCHKEPKGTDPDEPKVREFAKSESGIPWVQVNRLPGHVYFSHAMHVKLGKLDCKQCHGDMAAATESVTRSQINNLTMAACIECHKKNNVSQECLTCHK